jgi:hypothetical protein
MNEKELQEAREVAMLANRKGWKMVESYIESNMKPVEKKLFNEDLDKEEFKACQRERAAYKKVLDFVNRRVEAAKNN